MVPFAILVFQGNKCWWYNRCSKKF